MRGGAGTIRQLSGPSGPATWAGRDAWTTNLSPEQKPAWWERASPSWFASLPRDTCALRARLYADTAGHGSNPDDEAFVYVADAGPDLPLVGRALPGAGDRPGHDGDRATRHVGRRLAAVAIGRNDIFGSHNELIIDPDTGQVIGERSFMRLTPLVGERIALGTGVRRRLVDSIPADVRRTADRQTCEVVDQEVLCR